MLLITQSMNVALSNIFWKPIHKINYIMINITRIGENEVIKSANISKSLFKLFVKLITFALTNKTRGRINDNTVIKNEKI